MSAACSPARRRCRGVAFDHDPTWMSIAKAHTLLRCPLCGAEVTLSGGVDA
jgi:hypothetical protein